MQLSAHAYWVSFELCRNLRSKTLFNWQKMYYIFKKKEVDAGKGGC